MRIVSKVNALLRVATENQPEVKVVVGENEIPDDMEGDANLELYISDGSIMLGGNAPTRDELGALRKQIDDLTARNVELQATEQELRKKLADLTAPKAK